MNEPRRTPLGLRAGFTCLFGFAALGLVLEALHGFKIGFYLDVDNESRRLLWRLAHAHGGLLGLLNVCHALTVRGWPQLEDRATERSLLLALLLMPAGFFLGGLFARGADPGPAVGIAAAGAVALLFGLARFAWLLRKG